MILCAVQTIVKRNEREKQEDQQSECKRGRNSARILHRACLRGVCLSVCSFCVSLESDSEVAEEFLKPGHLSKLLEEDLSGDMSSLSLPEVNKVVTELLERLRSHRDDCQPHRLQVS